MSLDGNVQVHPVLIHQCVEHPHYVTPPLCERFLSVTLGSTAPNLCSPPNWRILENL